MEIQNRELTPELEIVLIEKFSNVAAIKKAYGLGEPENGAKQLRVEDKK